MKELSIEEKAKRYDEAIDKAKKELDACGSQDCDAARQIFRLFSELKESEDEDERIRKELIKFVKVNIPNEERYIAWLEKQGEPTDINPSEFDLHLNKLLKQFETLPKEELASSLSFYLNVVQNDGTYREEKQGEQKPQGKSALEAIKEEKVDNANKVEPKDYNGIDPYFGKPVDKVEPKFLNGQWIVWHGKCYTVYDNSCGYELLDQDGFITSLEYGTVEVNARLWDITKDAKDGDILADNLGVILFKSMGDNNVINYYAYLSGLFAVQKDEENWGYAVNCTLSPATKEQRERFFAAMNDAGFEWDADKLELYKKPKFKVGEWITDGQLTCKVLSVTGKSYELHLYNDDYCHFETDVQSVDKHYHLWTIQDTHDGDVLTSIGFHSNCTFILKGLDNWKFDEPNGDRAVATGYCCLSVSSDKMEFGIQGPDCVEVNTVKPASKIQRELLFKKMKEAGYEWDAKKKELNKIERKPIDKDEVLNILNKENQQVQQEDLIMKPSLKTKQNWSEEDKKRIQRISDFIWKNRKGDTDDIYQQEQDVKWLKSLRPQKQWKPSDEQMEVLEALVEDNNQRYFYTTLNSLYEQLKKLREE